MGNLHGITEWFGLEETSRSHHFVSWEHAEPVGMLETDPLPAHSGLCFHRIIKAEKDL